jgi:hypothetical protein
MSEGVAEYDALKAAEPVLPSELKPPKIELGTPKEPSNTGTAVAVTVAVISSGYALPIVGAALVNKAVDKAVELGKEKGLYSQVDIDAANAVLWTHGATVAEGVESLTEVYGAAKAVASGPKVAVPSTESGGPWIRFTRSKAEADAFGRTIEQIEGRLPLPPNKLGGGPKKWGSTFSNRPLQPGRAPELPPSMGPFEEYTTLLPGQTTRGELRTVTGASGEVFTSWTHYGQKQPFFPIDPLEPLPRVTFLRAK